MAWKVANYNALKKEADSLRQRYQNLQGVVKQTNEQLASLQIYAKEVSIAYGIKQKLEGPTDISAEGKLVPTFAESLSDYYFLRNAAAMKPQNSFLSRFRQNSRPSLWPVNGILRGGFGARTDPFSGEGAFHKGVDITAPSGTVVRATADGVVIHAGFGSGYGRLVVIDHGNGVHTYYAHLSRFHVVPGQEIRRGEPVGAVGTSGRVTAPHLHYEIRVGGVPRNPRPYLDSASTYEVARKDFPF
jgi:murein DD-endopeptidase MepM/ murein hydrolase activator NlpD